MAAPPPSGSARRSANRSPGMHGGKKGALAVEHSRALADEGQRLCPPSRPEADLGETRRAPPAGARRPCRRRSQRPLDPLEGPCEDGRWRTMRTRRPDATRRPSRRVAVDPDDASRSARPAAVRQLGRAQPPRDAPGSSRATRKVGPNACVLRPCSKISCVLTQSADSAAAVPRRSSADVPSPSSSPSSSVRPRGRRRLSGTVEVAAQGAKHGETDSEVRIPS
jgi:hypothetical protein